MEHPVLGCLLACGLALMVAPYPLRAQSPNSPDQDAIRKVVLDYIEGWHSANPERMERALHPDLVKRGALRSEKTGRQYLQPVSASSMVYLTESGVGRLKDGEVMDNHIEILDVYGDAAAAKAVSLRYVDYIHLVRWNGEWRILNVLWVPRVASKKP
jgi:hypothetical protein